MDATRMTYTNLFTLLTSLGFREQQSGEVPRSPRVFVHDKTDTVMLFRQAMDELVSPADLLSTEVRLHAKNIADQPLQVLLEQMTVHR
jgi:hypothetical protein